MKRFSRSLSALLCVCMLCSLLPPVSAASDSADTGSISLTLRLDYDQPLAQLQNRQIQVRLYQGQLLLGTLPLYQNTSTALRGHPAQVSVRTGYLDLAISGLPLGTYTLELTGLGYRTFRQDVTLGRYSQHVTLGTGDATFTLGDVNGDGWVNQLDRDAMSNAMGSTAPQDLRVYDFNGDNAIDIIDLTYLSRSITAEGGAQVLDTVIRTAPVELTAAARELTEAGVTVSGDFSDLFIDNGKTVGFTAAGEDHTVIPIPFTNPVEIEEIIITSPADGSGVQKGNVMVETEDGTVYEVPFDSARPLSRASDANTVTISLGRRVAVKKITITIEKNGKNQYTAIETIEFLKNIVPENPVAANSEIRGLTAVEGNEQVSLRWQSLPNLSGYQVEYWLRDGSGERRTLSVSTPQATITGLKNLTTYLFTVTPVDGSWKGKASAPVAGTPQPARAPAAPDMVNVSPLDAALSISWKASENAAYYEVYYTDQVNAPAASYQQYGSRTTSTRMTLHNLSNGTPYYIYIIAGNHAGESGPSRISTGTPTAVDYERPAGIPSAGVLEYDSFERVWLSDSGNVSSSAYPANAPFQPSYMADGNFQTHWTSQSYNDGNFARSKQVNCIFKAPQDLSAVLWVSRMDGNYSSNLRSYTVTVWTEDQDLNGPGTVIAPSSGQTSNTRTWPTVSNMGKFALLPFTPTKNVKKIAVTVEQVEYRAVSLSELMFLTYDPSRDLPGEVEKLFADEARTALASGVTLAQINALRDRLNTDEGKYYMDVDILTDELTLAEELLTGPSSGVVLDGLHALSGKNSYQQGGSVLQPLGAAAQAQADPDRHAENKLVIYASGIPEGETVTIYASQFNAEVSAWSQSMGTLQNGRNVLTIPKIGSQNTPRGGSLYYTYGGSHGSGIRLHVRMATDIPALELSDWYTLTEAQRKTRISGYLAELSAYTAKLDSGSLQTNCLNVTEIATPSVLLSLPASAVKAAQTDALYDSILAWEDVTHICLTTQGIDKTYAQNDMNVRQNIRCMQMFTGAFMYAAGNHIGIGFSSCAGMVAGKPVDKGNQLFGWGIAHEIGHNMDKLGKAEITNNIYALMVQTWDGDQNIRPSRLESSNKYPAIFTKVAQAHPGASNDVFVQLGLYWQLHLAYDNFYNRFFKAWKAGTYFEGQTSYDDKVALTASAVANRDLTEFFTRWGMTLSEKTKEILSKYPEEPRAIWYLNDQSRRNRLHKTGSAAGTFTAGAVVENSKEVKITIDSKLTGSVQGYEILRDGVSIGFTTGTSYTDVIGSANHRVYEYSVAAYDTLGNQIGTVKAGDVRIAYDDVVPASAYTASRDGDTWTFQLKEETAVSGIKLTGSVPAEGAFEVQVNGQTARKGNFSENQAVDDKTSFVSYLNKPGTEEPDTRIWTYDAKTVTVSGVPDGAEVQLIRYAGDDVSITAIGRLSADYKYGDKADEVIKKDTLVVVGTYRGDPVFNTVKLLGRYTVTAIDGDGNASEQTITRPVAGETILFAEIPADQQVSEISDGIFLFVPDAQQEKELQEADRCMGQNLLPSQLQAVIARTNEPDSTLEQHATAQSSWMDSPGGDTLPVIVLEGGAA